MAERILIIDDDPSLLEPVLHRLSQDGYTVHVAFDGESGLVQVRREVPDLVLLNTELPGIQGLDVCRRLRAEGNWVPVLALSTRTAVGDRVAALDAGADDYLVKPFNPEELLARIRALLRRYRSLPERPTLRLGDLVLNASTREVHRGSRRLNLTAREFDLLELFMRHRRQVLTRDIIYDHVWGFDYGGESNIIDVYVRYLRTKLEAGGEPRLLQTVRGVGYALREE